ncbi:hypothetical protein MIND_01230100 [Mycena indigotica]|uniref:Uncharacterized protein n=1 Tax=Mycena indigotica TaxID=2126181 RepID=A0A8H6S2J2_9AGAR|nr:uncharacterized protein MIND_01230100 [Mycena indigotica]KAF7292040.1 hypothetical protein MIND_01230100 [Mycena indigotica]
MAPSALPLELIYYIVDHLSNDTPSLRNFCLSASALAIVEHFQQSPHLVKHVSCLDIDVDRLSFPDIDKLSSNPKFFLQFTNLEALIISAAAEEPIPWHSVPEAITVALSALLVERSARPLLHLDLHNLDYISPDLLILALRATTDLAISRCIGSDEEPNGPNLGKHSRAPVVCSPQKTVIVYYSNFLLEMLAWPQLRPYLASIASFKANGDQDPLEPLLALYVLLAPTIPEIHFPGVGDISVEPEEAAALALPSSWPALRTVYAYIRTQKELEEQPSWMLTQLLANVVVPHSTPNLKEIRLNLEMRMQADGAGPQLEGPAAQNGSFTPATPIAWQLNATTLAALDAACASHPTLVALHWTISIRTYCLKLHRYADSDHALLEFAACCEALERALPQTKSSGRLKMEHKGLDT